MTTRDESMREFSHRLFERAPESVAVSESVDLTQGNRVPSEGGNPRPSSSIRWDTREFIDALFYGQGHP